MKKALKFFGIGGHSCKEVVEKLEILLDGELDMKEEERLIADIKKCPACLEHYDIDKAFKDFLFNKIERKCCTEESKAEILSKLKQIEAE